MDKKDLIQQVKLYLKDESVDPSINYDNEIIKFIDAFFLFNTNTSEEIFLKTFRALQLSVSAESNRSDYTVAENAIFGDFKDIRNKGFYKRYLHNVKLTKTYIKAYQLIENEYVETFGKKRYSSYDSFRIIKNRLIKKE